MLRFRRPKKPPDPPPVNPTTFSKLSPCFTLCFSDALDYKIVTDLQASPMLILILSCFITAPTLVIIFGYICRPLYGTPFLFFDPDRGLYMYGLPCSLKVKTILPLICRLLPSTFFGCVTESYLLTHGGYL